MFIIGFLSYLFSRFSVKKFNVPVFFVTNNQESTIGTYNFIAIKFLMFDGDRGRLATRCVKISYRGIVYECNNILSICSIKRIPVKFGCYVGCHLVSFFRIYYLERFPGRIYESSSFRIKKGFRIHIWSLLKTVAPV